MSDRDALDMDLEEEENEDKLLNPEKEEPVTTEESIENQIQKVLEENSAGSDIGSDAGSGRSRSRSKTPDSDDRQKRNNDSSDDEMERLRKAALQSKGSHKRRRKRDSCESRSNSEDEELTNMRRALLAQRAQKKPNDLRAKLTKPKISAFINPNISPKQPIPLRVGIGPQLTAAEKNEYKNFEVKRTVANSKKSERPVREIISEKKSQFKITRTVKNELSKKDVVIDTRDSSDSEEIEIKPVKKSSKRRSSRSVFQTASEMKVESGDDSLDELSSDSESSDGKDEVFVLRAGDKRGKKVVKPKKSKRRESPTVKKPAREIRSVKSRLEIESKSKSKKSKMTEKEIELEKKMERIRRDNEKREKRARLVEKEKRKYR